MAENATNANFVKGIENLFEGVSIFTQRNTSLGSFNSYLQKKYCTLIIFRREMRLFYFVLTASIESLYTQGYFLFQITI